MVKGMTFKNLLQIPSLALLLFVSSVTPFCPKTSNLVSGDHQNLRPSLFTPVPTSSASSSSTQLMERKEPYKSGKAVDGTGRGAIIQIFAVGICVWLFTVPPEFRRTYFCPAEMYCQEEGKCTRPCTTYSEFFKKVGDYYRGGGGIQWDFSISPETLKENQEMKEAIFGSK